MEKNKKEKKNWLKSFLTKAGSASDAVGKKVKTATDFVGATVGSGGKNIKQNYQLGKSQKELKNKMMKNYPSYTVIGEKKRAKREKEVLNMIKAGKMKQARELIKKKIEEYKKLNPNDKNY